MDEDSDTDNTPSSPRPSNSNRKRKWYRKHTRDNVFYKKGDYYNSSDSEQNSSESENSNVSDGASMDDGNNREHEERLETEENIEQEERVEEEISGEIDEMADQDSISSPIDSDAASLNDGNIHEHEEPLETEENIEQEERVEEEISGEIDEMADQDSISSPIDSDAASLNDGNIHEHEERAETEESDGQDGQDGPDDSNEEEISDDYGTSEEEDGGEQEEVNNDNTPIFNGGPITFRESALAILTFILTHKLTGLCVTDLLLLLSLHCGANNILLKTLFKFKKYFQMIGKNFVKLHYYCSNCEKLLPRKNDPCCAYQQLDTYFIEFPIINQLEIMFARPGFYEDLQYRFTRQKKVADNVEDIYDGEMYQQLFDDGGFLSNPNNVSFFLYFDGVAVFKSSNFSIWPAYLTINELKYKLRTRKENTVLAGLWFGRRKPNPNLFLKPIYDFFVDFEANGRNLTLPNGQIINVKGRVLGAVGDLPAKALFMRFIQYNGAFSCFSCLQQGGRYDMGRNTIQVFPYTRDFELRNIDETADFAAQAIAARQQDPDANVYGVKGPSLLLSLLPNMILCMGSDIMHGVFLGCQKTLNTLWFDGQYSESPFSISNLAHLVDARLKNIHPPSTFQNMPRSIKKDMANWKAFDLKAFFFSYSLIVLRGILPDVYWFHHVKLVAAISLLNQESICQTDFESAEALLHSYVSEFQELYGIRHMTLNFHQLLHLPLICKNLGPAWVFSCFFYESLNGQLVKLVHGTRHVALQICSSSSVFMKLPVMLSAMPESAAKQLCLQFQARLAQKVKVTENIDFQTGVVGKLRLCYPVPQFISRYLTDVYEIVGGRYKYFDRLKRKGLVYTSQSYERSTQEISYYVEIFHDNVPHLAKVNNFIRWSSCRNNCPIECNNCRKLYFCIVSVYNRLVWDLHEAPLVNVGLHLNKVTPTNEVRAYPVESLRSMCVYICLGDGDEYLVLPVNNIEVE